ncbi:MAG TPA: CSLREA domain-containing protein [Solirubrobacterales bacterium]|nr:CSLREA domain-containing protein [Solirubrobacterales bacterium]HNE78470.1 CSLREA domain-containing protein [Solirubrobacterales bacterium]HNH86280.1 CSLREA domain-containing protein [Solirubrobacterales bacterium]HNL62487.1 CSLREA domain-containing protein [Solirubrobacterales bacterium]
MKGFLAGAFALLALLVAPAAANAVIITVNTTADEYGTGTSCSLREAITAAQNNVSFGGCPAGFASDTVSIPDGTYKITRAGTGEDGNATGDFDITGSNALDIQPDASNAHVVVDGNGIDRVFQDLSSGLVKFLAIQITGGKLTGFNDGAGIQNSVGVTSLENVTVNDNSSEAQGGGVAVYNNVQVINSTIAQNNADGNGGGFYVPGGASLVARSTTVFGNQADADGDGNGYGGGFAETGGLNVSFTNVLNAGNSGTALLPTDDAYDCYSGPNFYPRYTLSGQPMGPLDCLVGFNPGTNMVSSDVKLDPFLRDNGGQTPTLALLPGSPAIGAGGTASPDECPGFDQNDRPRPAGKCDIGAVQFVAEPGLIITKLLPKKKVIKRKKTRAITVQVRNDGTGPAKQVKICLKLNRAAKKGLKVKGKACKSVGTVAVGARKSAKIKLMAKPKARKKAYSLKATFKGSNAPLATRAFKVRVK